MYSALLRMSVALLVVAAICGCGQSTKDRLVGKWAGVVEVDQAALDAKLASMDRENPLAARLMHEGLQVLAKGATLDVELRADGTLTSNFKAGLSDRKQEGTWSIKSEDGKKVVLTIVESGNPRDDTLTFVGDNELIMDAPGEAQGIARVRFKKLD